MSGSRMQELRTWYRQALVRRAASLEALVTGIDRDPVDAGAAREVADIAQALQGSGGTFGFPRVSEAARVVAADGRDGILPRVLGLIDLLHDVAEGGDGSADRTGKWLIFAAGPLPESAEGDTLTPDLPLKEGWRRAAARLGVTPDDLARRVAERLGIGAADPTSAENLAGQLVPPALALEHRLLPLAEDGARIVAASSNPTDILAMAALERATGRTASLEVLHPESLGEELGARYGARTGSGILDHVLPPPAPDRGAFREDGPQGTTVLVVDDEPDARLLCRTILERDGFKVAEAEGGQEALEILARDPGIALALVDVLMPGMHGRALLRAIREDPKRAALPVIVLTGLQASGTEAQLMEQGADDYLRKPVEPPILLARIRALLRRVQAAAPS